MPNCEVDYVLKQKTIIKKSFHNPVFTVFFPQITDANVEFLHKYAKQLHQITPFNENVLTFLLT